jgi:hypothetical protein
MLRLARKCEKPPMLNAYENELFLTIVRVEEHHGRRGDGGVAAELESLML